MSILRQAALLGSCLRGPAALLHPHSWARGYGLGSHVSNDDPLVLEREKERALKGKNKSSVPDVAPGWNERLASDSEAVVKAEQSHMTLKEMQDTTIEVVEEESRGEEDQRKRESGSQGSRRNGD